MNKAARETITALKGILDSSGGAGKVESLASDMALAGLDLSFHQDAEVARLGRDLCGIAERLSAAERDIRIAETRMAGLL